MTDEQVMRMALALAARGRGTTRPNPMVGAVIVRGGRVVARGYHRRAGQPHAEVEALARAGRKARGATLYVTLEPCCHVGRTGPCTEPILRAGITRVVVGCRDENPLVSGRGIARLRRAGVRVDVGCLQAECLVLNQAFFRWIRDGRPQVTLKVATTLDGFIAPARQRGITWITGEPARRVAHELRAAHDAVLVGAGTVWADDPQLNVRLKGKPQPLRVVLDGKLRVGPGARLFQVRGARPLVIAARLPGAERRARRLDAEVLLLRGRADGTIPLSAVLRALAERDVQSLLVEGGSRVLGAFVAARLVDRVAWFIAPRLAGGGVPVVQGPGLGWNQPLRLTPPSVRRVGQDLLLTADVVL